MSEPILDPSRLIDFSKRIDYTSLDWYSILTDMVNYIPDVLPEWTDYSPSDFGIVMLELFSAALDVIAYRIDVFSEERYIQTAVLRDSVESWAKLIGYRPAPRISASVDIEIAIDVLTYDLTVPKGFKISTARTAEEVAKIFELQEAVVFTAGETLKTGEFFEGETFEEIVGSSTGLPYQFFELSRKPLAYNPDGTSSLEVYVTEGGIERLWSRIDTLLESTSDAWNYEEKIDEEEIITILFGDNKNGKIPDAGIDNIRVAYRVGGGIEGNVGANTITQIISTTPQVKTINNPSSATNGADREAIRTIKSNAPRTLRTLWRAVTLEDYKTLAEGLPGVAKAMPDCNPQGGWYWNRIDLYIAPSGGGLPSTALKDLVSEYFDERQILTNTLIVQDPTYVPVNVEIIVNAQSDFLNADVKLRVETLIDDYLSFANVDFGLDLYHSEFYGEVELIEGVHYSNLSVFSRTVSGVSDVTIDGHEIPERGTVTVTVTGGIG